MKPIIAMVGRPNVGKSTLFNRLAKRRVAVVEDTPGVTRDRLFVDVVCGGREVILVDTGGFDPDARDEFARGAVAQAKLAVAEADVVWFMVDAKDGLHPLDQMVADYLRKQEKPILCLVNKSDPGARTREDWDFLKLGMDLLPVSALHGDGLDELAAWSQSHLPPEEAAQPDSGQNILKLCLLGRPNVGKSSLANRLIGHERQMVSAIPGTTRDAVDIALEREGVRCLLVDTPGVRRKARVQQRLEYYSVMAALRSLERADVAAIMLDMTEPFSDQDARLLRLAQERGRGILVLANKADLLATSERKKYLKELAYTMRFAAYARVLTVSAQSGEGTEQILPQAAAALDNASKRITTGDLNRFFSEVIDRHDPPMIKGKRAKFYYLTQTNIRPPTFVLWVNDASRIPESYRRYIENQLRRRFPFEGTPIHWIFREHEKRKSTNKRISKRSKRSIK
jgi:GTP-binding protein